MRYVLDANIAIAALNDVGGVRKRLATVAGTEVTNDHALLDGSIRGLRAENWLT